MWFIGIAGTRLLPSRREPHRCDLVRKRCCGCDVVAHRSMSET
jgi:hypothetical protein